MFGITHPQPPHRKEVAMHIVQHEQGSFASHALTMTPPSGEVAPPPDDAPVRFSVRYTLLEYMSILRQHIGFTLRQTPPGKRRRDAVMTLMLGVLAAGAAWLLGPGWGRTMSGSASLLAFASLPFMLDLWLALLIPPIFLLKRRRMPVCDFVIGAGGIERTTRQGKLVRTWGEVKMVRRYRRGYLFMFAKGGMPIPFRCLDQHQQERLRAFTTSRGLADGAA